MYDAVGWFAVCDCGTCNSMSDSLIGHLIYITIKKRSAILCKLMSVHDNLLLAVKS